MLVNELEEDLDSAKVADANDAPPVVQYVENCTKCGGTGVYRGYSSYGSHCFACDGKGVKTFKTSAAQRSNAKEKAKAAKERKLARNLAAFEADNPDIAAWWADTDFAFAISLKQAVQKYGYLTERQHEAALRAIAKRLIAKDEAAQRLEVAPVIDVTQIEQVFQTAKISGLKSPKLRLGTFSFKPAAAHSKNVGALYVTENGEYLGKITAGKFLKVRECSADKEAEVLKVAAAPKDAAVAYGRLTGCCAVCGRLLENKESVERGIGPICAEKFGW